MIMKLLFSPKASLMLGFSFRSLTWGTRSEGTVGSCDREKKHDGGYTVGRCDREKQRWVGVIRKGSMTEG